MNLGAQMKLKLILDEIQYEEILQGTELWG